jgi:EAL domain-containing protein (putative c-di-GMP-specific phosphodiesterase class I)
MTAPAAGPSPPSSLAPLLEHFERVHFPASRFTEPQPGTVAAQFFQSRLTSAFQPIVRAADNGVAGHHALLRVFDEGGEAVAPWSLFAQASRDAMLVQLDRLSRTVHALNYFPLQSVRQTLFLNVERRMLTIAAEDHGAYFELILKPLGVATSRVAIVLPAAALDDAVTFVRAAIAYRIRGYRVVAQLRADAEADLEHVFLADPHFVALDGRHSDRARQTRKIVDAISRRGIHALARHIEDEEQSQAARDVGFGFLQGRHFAPPKTASNGAAIA